MTDRTPTLTSSIGPPSSRVSSHGSPSARAGDRDLRSREAWAVEAASPTSLTRTSNSGYNETDHLDAAAAPDDDDDDARRPAGNTLGTSPSSCGPTIGVETASGAERPALVRRPGCS
eukprot:3940895-Rhodomonas_salina.5